MACDAGCSCDSRRSQIDLAVHMTHTAHKVAVGTGNAALTGSQNAHMATQAGAAGGSGHDTAGIQEDVGIAQMHTLALDTLGCGDDDAADTGSQMLTLQHGSSGSHIGQLAVGAGANHNLVDGDILALGSRMRILG